MGPDSESQSMNAAIFPGVFISPKKQVPVKNEKNKNLDILFRSRHFREIGAKQKLPRRESLFCAKKTRLMSEPF